jgi:hypothetical protein
MVCDYLDMYSVIIGLLLTRLKSSASAPVPIEGPVDTENLGESEVGHLTDFEAEYFRSREYAPISRHGIVACQYWSEKAMNLWKKSQSASDLRVDFLIPMRSIYEYLVVSQSSDPDEIERFLKRWLIRCVITSDEAKLLRVLVGPRMPESWGAVEGPWEERDKWARYRIAFGRVGIVVCKVSWADGELGKYPPVVFRV